MHSPGSPPTALLFHLSGLGDTLFFLPALAAWKARQPDLKVTALTMFPACRDLLAHCPLVDEVIDRDFLRQPKRASLAFFAGLRARRFDTGVLPLGSNRIEYNAAQWLAGARQRLAHRYRLDPWAALGFLNTLRSRPRPHPGRHAVEANLALLAEAGLIDAAMPPPAGPFLVLPPGAGAAAEAARAAEPGRRWIGVHAGSNTIKNQSRKCYPPALLARALRQIAAARPGVLFLLLEGESDRERTSALAEALPPELYRRVRPGGIVECAAWIERCEVMIGNDSGLVHLAAFLGRPCVAVFGPTCAATAHPWGVPHRVVTLGLPCQPCFDYSRRPLSCPRGIDFACVGDLPPERVAEAFASLEAEVSV